MCRSHTNGGSRDRNSETRIYNYKISQTATSQRDASTLPQNEDTLTSVIHTLDNVSFIDDDNNAAAVDDDDEDDDKEIPYHARQDSRPFTYGSVAQNTGNYI